MAVCQFGYFPAAWGAHQVTFLDEERFVNFFDGTGFFPDSSSDGIDPNRPSFEFLNDGGKDAIVHLIQSVNVDIQGFQGELGNSEGDGSVALDLGEIPDPAQQQVGDTGRSTATAGYF